MSVVSAHCRFNSRRKNCSSAASIMTSVRWRYLRAILRRGPAKCRLTDHMKQLDGRATYSTDLRVRQAEADIYLAMEGWHRNQEAVDLLIERADSDKTYRPSAYYFLGMEGGRGVDSERVFAILRERALSDPDPVVRQWAVEGLRFYKTDEALNVLYESFTTDASYNVRDRAGCNVSDCGIFTRVQRCAMFRS